jgi:hypothetical protein
MPPILDPILMKDLAESKAALARHGIVIMRSVENLLEPAMMAQVKDSMASSPEVLDGLRDDELDDLMKDIRATAIRSARKLAGLYTRLLAKLGTEFVVDLAKEVRGIKGLFVWDRVAREVDPVNKKLEKAGFRPITLPGPESLSASFAVELTTKWPVAFDRFSGLVRQAASAIEEDQKKTMPSKKPPTKTKRRKTTRSRKT